MSLLTLNGASVLRARITLPREGAWTAEVTVDAREVPKGPVTLTTFDRGLTLVGAVERGDIAYDAVSTRVVGGAGGLERELPAKFFRALPARVVVQELLDAAGEKLSPKSDTTRLGRNLPMWAREATSASRALTSVVTELGATWRVGTDGAVWIGRDTWPAAPAFAHDVLERFPAEDRVLLGVEAPRLLPGTTFLGRRVSLVVHTLDDDGVRTEAWFEREGEDSRLGLGLRRLLRKAFARVDYLALYPAKVVSQNGDGTLELKPDAEKMPGLSRVPLRAGLPGVKIKVAGGARVLVAFENGDPARPVATLWEEPGLKELQVGGARPVARQGDQVTLTMPPVVPIMGVVNGSQPFVGTMQIPTPLIGSILTGSGSLKA